MYVRVSSVERFKSVELTSAKTRRNSRELVKTAFEAFTLSS